MEYKISATLLQKMVSILSNLPYHQVAQILDQVKAEIGTEVKEQDQ